MNRTIGLISANYDIPGFDILTRERPPVSVPYAGRYRLLDFALSNMVNSRIQTVALITPHYYRSIMDHIGAGKEWDLDRKNGGLYILPGTAFGFRDPDSRFLFRDILHNLNYFRRGDGDYILVSSGTLTANIDYQPMIAQHELSGRNVTLLYRKTAPGEKRRGYYLTMSATGEVKNITLANEGENLFLNSFIVDRSLVLRLARDFSAMGYLDFMAILTTVLPDLRVGTFRYDGHVFFMDGTEDYFRSSMALLDPALRHELFTRERQIRTKIHDTPPALYVPGSEVRNSLMTAGSVIEGTVADSVVFRQVRIEKGAHVKNCVLMEGCTVKAGARLENVICDKYVTITADKTILGTPDRPCVIPKDEVI